MRRVLPALALLMAVVTGCRTEVPTEREPGTPHPASENVSQNVVRSRAVEAVIWGVPIVNYDLMV